ncbi:hypothetical protein FSP39_002285 [Pinctada imbricata]|uniref:LRRCT domain-containing protein n=1 Tax=Pinctada imbricata TaxID=66713 RepID=A0AA88Y9M7_PINIB|nr:hypothetical protein FSP39_002285 [Pinctada imbricata]
MKNILLYCGLTFILLPQTMDAFGSYPRRYSRDTEGANCPHQCRCMRLLQRGTRELFDDGKRTHQWTAKNYERDPAVLSDSPSPHGRSMICQGLRTAPIPNTLGKVLEVDNTPRSLELVLSPLVVNHHHYHFPYIMKLTIYGDGSGSAPRGDDQSIGRYRAALISDTQIRYIDKESFKSVPGLTELTMFGNNIGILYPYIFYHLKSLEILNLPNNNIRHLSAAVFSGLSGLKELRLSDNLIRFLPSTMFNFLPNLRILNLNGNKIRFIQRDLFQKLSKLEILDLSRNNITDLYDTVFDSNTELRELLLNGNRLWKIRPRWFRNLQNLRSFSLSGNTIRVVESGAFSNLVNLQELLLSANHIVRIQDGAFEHLRELRILDLATNDIEEIPPSLFLYLDSLEELYLGTNNLKIIRNGTFSAARSLIRLDLSRNTISYIDPGALRPLKMLQYLDLAHNKFTTMRSFMIFGLDELKEINLEHNFINTIETDTFKTSSVSYLSKVSVLNLKSNNLRKLDADSLQGLPHLKSLELGNNKLKRVHSLAFANVGNLRTLELQNNKIKRLSNGIFTSLHRLLELDLSSNKIRTVGSDAFQGLDNLEDLDMSSNGIHDIDENSFRPLRSLTNLNLRGNRLLSFNFTLVTKFPQLSSLDLSENYMFWIDIPEGTKLRLKELNLNSNHLKTVGSDLTQIMSSSSYVSFTGNPLACDCHLRWLLDPGLSSKTRIENMDDVVCKTPNKLHGRRVSHLMEEDLICDTQELQKDQPSMICDEMTFTQKQHYDSRFGNKAAVSRHVTIFTENNEPLANGVMLNDDWALTIGSHFKSSRTNKLKVRIGRSKKPRDIVSIIRHPLVAMNMQQYNVAVVKLASRKKGKSTTIPCFLTYKQFASLSKIVPRVMVTTRISGKKLFSKLKPKKGRLSTGCKNKDFVCAKIKNSKKSDKPLMMINGSPMYLGKASHSRLGWDRHRHWHA